ncbi:MAG TPA: hypothetical protein VF054_13245 [Micromonosporaceae bacterium]
MAGTQDAEPPDTGTDNPARDQARTRADVLRVRVVDHSKDGDPAVNIRVPIGVVKFGMKMAQAFSPEVRNADLDWDSINAMIREGELGKIVDVEDEAEHKTIEVWVE